MRWHNETIFLWFEGVEKQQTTCIKKRPFVDTESSVDKRL